MQQKTADELVCFQGHETLLVAVPIISPPEADLCTLQPQNTVIGDGDAVSVAAEIVKDFFRTGKRRLGHGFPAGKRARQRIQGTGDLVNVAHGYVRVPGGSCHTSMTQKELDCSQILSGFQEMRSEGMPKGVGSNAFAQP